MVEKVVILKTGDVFEQFVRRDNEGEESRFLLKVVHVNTDSEGRDYLWANYQVSETGVPASMTLYLSPGEKNGERARIPSEFVTDNGALNNRIRRIKPPQGVRWSYED